MFHCGSGSLTQMTQSYAPDKIVLWPTIFCKRKRGTYEAECNHVQLLSDAAAVVLEPLYAAPTSTKPRLNWKPNSASVHLITLGSAVPAQETCG